MCLKYNVNLDTICGRYHLNLTNSRCVLHALQLSNALYLTLLMFQKKDLKTSQRLRKGRFRKMSGNLLTQIFLQVYNGLKSFTDEKKIIKCIKNSLCMLVSLSMNQEELPEGDHIDLFPQEIKKSLEKELSDDDYVRFCFSCLQSKVLCQVVPEDFILDTLIKHRTQLSSPHRGLKPEYLELLYKRGQEFGKKVRKYYHPNKGYFPTGKATYAFPRNRGGVKGDLAYHDRIQEYSFEDPNDRSEPYVIGLFGQPGSGKSTAISQIVSRLSVLFPGVSPENLVYQRTCHVEFWDGYNGQPITILDDLGQSKDGHDIQEFQTLVSCIPYVVPMAALEEKGLMFQSPIIICTSNLLFGSKLSFSYDGKSPIIDDASFWRRFHEPFLLEQGKCYQFPRKLDWTRPDNFLTHSSLLDWAQKVQVDSKAPIRPYAHGLNGDKSLKDLSFQEINLRSFPFMANYQQRQSFAENIRMKWKQVVFSKTTDNFDLEPLFEELNQYGLTNSPTLKAGKEGKTQVLSFDAFPSEGLLPVRVEPIVEPLKVRTITAGIGDTFALKPFQVAMWKALFEEPQFCLTHGTKFLEPSIRRIYNSSEEGDVWISGDYSAATDSFSIEGSQALMRGILESIDHEPTKRWVMKELSPHKLVYPQRFGAIEPALQRSGQLMGSLTSFPLLNLLNDCTARMSGLKPTQYLINGDDILMRTKPENYPIWKKQVQEFGLDLSLGKNYIHPRYGTVNSQLIIDGEVAGSGKQRVLSRHPVLGEKRILGECLRDLELNMPETPSDIVQELFKTVNRQSLSQTVRNINVPVSHGGLSFSWGLDPSKMDSRSERTAKLCYLHDLLKKVEPEKGCVAIPYLSKSESDTHNSDVRSLEKCFNEPVSSVEFVEDLLGPYDLRLLKKRFEKNDNLRNFIFQQDLSSLPSLTFLKTYQIPLKNKQMISELQARIDKLFFERFLTSPEGFDYWEFRKDVIGKAMGENICESTRHHLVSLIDLDISTDALDEVNLDFNPVSFDKKKFEKSLGKTLSPRYSDIQLAEAEGEDPSMDFSREVLKAQARSYLNGEKEEEQSSELFLQLQSILPFWEVQMEFKDH